MDLSELSVALAIEGDDLVYPDEVTASAEGALGQAGKIAQALGASKIETSHLLAAYLFRDHGHSRDLDQWGLEQDRWRRRFLQQLAIWNDPSLSRWLQEARIQESYDEVGQFVILRAVETSAEKMDQVDLFEALLVRGAERSIADVQRILWPRILERRGTLDRPPVGSAVRNPVPMRRDVETFTEAIQSTLGFGTCLGLTSASRKTAPRHLLAAVLSSPSPELIDVLGSDFPPSTLLAKLREQVALEHPDEIPTWNRMLDGHEIRIAGYAPDVARGDDMLEIERDVHGLAAIIASKNVSPPMSIGLFGDWGSGKSFFLGKLKERIRELEKVGVRTKTSAYHGGIQQIEFNAWHYVDVDLWASLAAHVWGELGKHVRGQALQDELHLIAERREELSTVVALAETRRKDAHLELRRAEESKASAFATLRAVLGSVPEVEAMRAEVMGAAGVDPSSPLALQEARTRVDTFVGRISIWRRNATAVDWLLLSFSLSIVPALAFFWEQLAPSLVRVVASLVALATPLLPLVDRGRAVLRPIERYLDQKDALDAASRAPRVAEAEATLAKADAELGLAQRNLADAEAEERRLRRELAKLDEAPDMRRLVLERASSEDYTKRLGLISTIRRDFEDLAKGLAALRERAQKEPLASDANGTSKESPAPPFDRIVLYVDDLDRCPPERVVEVLQAVHLLLSIDLFVVVVAVDSRWLLQSLEDYFARRFSTKNARDESYGDAALLYLEKIFQIPFALRPQQGQSYERLLTSLVGGPTVRAAAPTRPVSREREVAPSRAPGSDGSSARRAPASSARPARAPVPSPRNLELEPEEIERFHTASALMSSPRATKRWVNLYRIVRAGIRDEELDDFVMRAAGPTQLFLGLVVGEPRLARELLESIFDGSCRSFSDLSILARARSEVAQEGEPDARRDPRWVQLHALLRDRTFLDREDWHAIEDAARLAARFSFETSRLLQTTPKPWRSSTARAPLDPESDSDRP